MYTWAENKIKLQRAISLAQGSDEAAVKEAYLKLGGKLNGDTEAPRATEPAGKEPGELAPPIKEPIETKEEEVKSEEVKKEKKTKAKKK